MAIDAFRQQPLAATLATARESGASALGPHARAEAVLAFTSSFRWLKSAFHKAEKFRSARIESGYLRMERGIVNAGGRRVSIYSLVASASDFCD